MSEIGNKELLRFIDFLLKIEDQQGTPAALETATVQPVIDIGRFIAGTYSIQQATGTRLQEGTPLANQVIASPNGGDPDPIVFNSNIEMRILAVVSVITLGANSAVNDGLIPTWRLRIPGENVIEFAGNFARQPAGTIINETIFACYPGALAGPLGLSSTGNIGGLLQRWVPAGTEFSFKCIYQDSLGVAKNFPTNTTVRTDILYARTARGIVPPL